MADVLLTGGADEKTDIVFAYDHGDICFFFYRAGGRYPYRTDRYQREKRQEPGKGDGLAEGLPYRNG